MFRRLLAARALCQTPRLTTRTIGLSQVHLRAFSACPQPQKKAKGKAAKGSKKAAEEEPLEEQDPSVVLSQLEKQCSGVLDAFKKRAADTKQGAANAAVFDHLDVMTGHKETQPYTAVAQTSVKGRNLTVVVFDPANVKHVVSAILGAGLNMNPQEVPNFPQQLKVPLPAPTAEHRKDIAKELKKDFEHFRQSASKQSLSTARGAALKELKAFVKNDTVKKAEKEVEKVHKKFLDELQKQFKATEKSVLG